MKTKKIVYWITTVLLAAFMLFSSIGNIVSNAPSIELLHDKLGYPLYFIPFIGLAKAAGSIVILIPNLRKLKEWAYAGLFFDLIGATWSLYSIGLSVPEYIFMVLPISFCGVSYYLWSTQSEQ